MDQMMNQKIITELPEKILIQLHNLTKELQNLGINNVGHGLIYPHRTPTAYFSSSKWADLYNKENLVSYDPIRIYALKTNHHLLTWDSIIANKKQLEVIEERKKYFESSKGMVISIKTPYFHETLTLGYDAKSLASLPIFRTAHILSEYLLKFRAAHSQYYSPDSL